MTVPADCWIELTGVVPPPNVRHIAVTVGTGDPTLPTPTASPAPKTPLMEGDIFVSTDLKKSWVWDKETTTGNGWVELGGGGGSSSVRDADNAYWGYGIAAPNTPPAGHTTVVGEAKFDGTDLSVWDGTTWVVKAVVTGDEYTDLSTGRVYALAP